MTRRHLRPTLFRVVMAFSVALVGNYSTAPAYAREVRKAVLPLGDGRIGFKPAKGTVFVCNTNFMAGGAFRDGAWIAGGQWYPDGKVTVDGDVAWPDARIVIVPEGGQRVIRGNGLPVNQRTGAYPVAAGSEAYKYDRNPNRILPQPLTIRLPMMPQLAKQPDCVPMGMVGVTLTGVGIFNALDAMGRDAAAHEIQDQCNGHPERRGQYHYHHFSACIPDKAGEEGMHSELVGYMLDGFGIFGPVGAAGKRLTNADLDACHGHSHEIEWDGQRIVMYHYHFADEYPYSIGCFRGQVIR